MYYYIVNNTGFILNVSNNYDKVIIKIFEYNFISSISNDNSKYYLVPSNNELKHKIDITNYYKIWFDKYEYKCDNMSYNYKNISTNYKSDNISSLYPNNDINNIDNTSDSSIETDISNIFDTDCVIPLELLRRINYIKFLMTLDNKTYIKKYIKKMGKKYILVIPFKFLINPRYIKSELTFQLYIKEFGLIIF